MKILSLIFMVFLFLCSSCAKPAPSTGGAERCAGGVFGETYQLDAVGVTEGNIAVFTDENGNVWACELPEGITVNQHVILVMDDCGTPDFIYDDMIVEWR